ncbi:HAD family hydrolase [Desulfoferrobacter suflitae]|uniref:HAD family hydrolase n=1 Tax=Desulfoferrobacter suflitae TaxID=2865782 RepID=UPI0021645023|nr:ATPase P [Desulfoferrobacter suflitae]MCK8602581.1 ATPase P [Desulfoferrobacter suflitae]
MLKIAIPGGKALNVSHLVLDCNGTIALDGGLIAGVAKRLAALAGDLEVHVLTADTFGSVEEQLTTIHCRLSIIPKEDQARAKKNYVQELGPDHCVCIGNGRNDHLMLRESALGIAVIQTEGAALASLTAADVISTSILDALDLLLHPLRLTATLRM